MLLMDWKRDNTAESLVMLRPRMWLLFMRLTNVVTAFCSAFRNCSWFSSDSPFWYCCWKEGWGSLSAVASQCQEPAASLQSQRIGCFLPLGRCQTQAQAPSYLNHPKRGRVGFPRLHSWLRQGQGC